MHVFVMYMYIIINNIIYAVLCINMYIYILYYILNVH